MDRLRRRRPQRRAGLFGGPFSPDNRFVVSLMQENALHGWRLRDKADMRMSG